MGHHATSLLLGVGEFVFFSFPSWSPFHLGLKGNQEDTQPFHPIQEENQPFHPIQEENHSFYTENQPCHPETTWICRFSDLFLGSEEEVVTRTGVGGTGYLAGPESKWGPLARMVNQRGV